MSSFLNELWSIEKSYAVPFKAISLCSSFAKSFDMPPKQKLYQRMLSFLLNLQICFYLHTINSHYHCNFNLVISLCFTKVNTSFFSAAPVLSLILSVGPSPNTKKLFFQLLV